MKYITFEGQLHQEAVIFATSRDHGQMAYLLNIKEEDILGAGFCQVGYNGIQCFGKSQSLKISSRGEIDELLISKLID